MSDFFTLEKTSGKARAGKFVTSHGVVETPIFMPVGTRACVKMLTSEDLEELGAQIILGNTYHLYLKPGHDIVEECGGLHGFMSWDRPVLTDSGGFQVFSLADINKISEEGVQFQSHIDGSRHMITPEKSMEIQRGLGSDIVMAFDECPALPCTDEKMRESVELTLRWAKRCADVKLKSHQHLFGIVQGGLDVDLRVECMNRLLEITDADGEKAFTSLAIGGLSVGEKNEQMYQFLDEFTPQMPQNMSRYLMGVGTPVDLIKAIGSGVDMFDCVLPTRNARNGQILTNRGPINIKNAKFAKDQSAPDPDCSCKVCKRYTKAYLRHLQTVGEFTASRLISYHNLYFYLDLMKRARAAIFEDRFQQFLQQFLENYLSSKK
ncbi:MAG: tRNA guanosine(34) transglycosylase Tgt [Bacteriovoracaceae bacterium]|nr:tRNA guanosine(34) transglycosylase Tgt [Bacteriovoracaceae bacterium]